MEKTGTITAVTARQKQDGSGEYYLVDIQGEPQHLCFDKKAAAFKVGEIIKYLSIEKNGKYFLNFPKDKAFSSGGFSGGGGRKDDTSAKINAILQSHTMPMSYAKDICVALINSGKLSGGDVSGTLISIYKELHGHISRDNALQGLLALKPSADMPLQAKPDLRLLLREFLAKWRNDLTQRGWSVSDRDVAGMLARMSQTKSGDKLVGGHASIDAMTNDEAAACLERLRAFSDQCPGNHDGCKFYKPAGQFCAWSAKCFFKT